MELLKEIDSGKAMENYNSMKVNLKDNKKV